MVVAADAAAAGESPRHTGETASTGTAVNVPPSFGQPGIRISYRPKELVAGSSRSSSLRDFAQLTVTVPPASIHHIFNHRQWRAGMLMSDAIASRAFDLAGRNVLELGAGTGLPSITAAKLGVGAPKLVVASDYDEAETVRALRANVRANVADSQRIKVCGHIWGKNTEELTDCLPAAHPHPQPQPQLKFDSILLADCLWDPLSHADLLKTVTSTLSRTPEARVNVIAGLHTGRDKITGFIRRAHRAGLTLAPIACESSWPQLQLPLPADANATLKSRDEPLRHAAERIMELQVSGNTPAASTENQDEAEDHADEPRLSGQRRIFLVDGYGDQEEGNVRMRNKWLTVWSLMWAAP